MAGTSKSGAADLASVRAAIAMARTASGAAALAWLERALRLAPGIPSVAYVVAARMADLDPARAETIIGGVIDAYPAFREARVVRATCLVKLGKPAEAASCLDAMLRRFAAPSEQSFAALAAALCANAGHPGWVGVDAAGGVVLAIPQSPRARPKFWLDGRAVTLTAEAADGEKSLPARWREAAVFGARLGARDLLGSPADLAARRRVEGFVGLNERGDLAGWAWFPADPDRPVPLTLHLDSSVRPLLAREESVAPRQDRLLDRPREFAVPAAGLVDVDDIRVTGPDGRDLAGSPLSPGRARQANRSAARRFAADFFGTSAPPGDGAADPWRPLDALALSRPWEVSALACVPRRGGGKKIDVVIPVWRGAEDFSACLESLRGQVPAGTRIVVVDDSSDDPALRALLAEREAAGDIIVLRHPENRGFPAAANTGMRHALADRRDVLLLNPDTLMPPGALARLARIARADAAIGSVTAMSNDGTLVSHPAAAAAAAPADVAAWDRVFASANGFSVVDLPSAVGFCMYIRESCLRDVGLFREDVFAQGYGEENDWSFRARHLGFRHVAATGVFVAHRGGRSFGAVRRDLMRRNRVLLNRLHPGYDADVDSFTAKNPLAPARRAVDTARWAAGRAEGGAVILLTHGRGGGVNRFVAERGEALRRAGVRPIVLIPDPFPPADPDRDDDGDFAPGVRVGEADRPAGPATARLWLSEDRAHERVPEPAAAGGGGDSYPDLRFALPGETEALVALLAADRPARVELHHFMGHALDPADLARRLGVPLEIVVHDSAGWCPRVTMLDGAGRYCGEPAATELCVACVRDHGGRIRDDISVPALRARSAAWLAAARRVVVSCDDAARRVARHFPGTRPDISPWEDDAALLRRRRARPAARPATSGARAKIVVTGGIGPDKGLEVLVGCARDAAARDLPLDFVVVGYSGDDARLLETGRVFVTGRFTDGEGPDLVAAQQAQLGFIPSVIPETWCYALSVLWEGGLRVAAFALGAQAERIARAGTEAGAVLPLGLPPARVNDLLLALARRQDEK